MKIIFLAALLLFGSASAVAGLTPCLHPEKMLICDSSYRLVEGYGADPSDLLGPAGKSQIRDAQSEPFDPSQCEASVVLFTYIGRFVATYYEGSGKITAWLESDGRVQNVIDTLEPVTSLEIPSPFKGIVKSTLFKCQMN